MQFESTKKFTHEEIQLKKKIKSKELDVRNNNLRKQTVITAYFYSAEDRVIFGGLSNGMIIFWRNKKHEFSRVRGKVTKTSR